MKELQCNARTLVIIECVHATYFVRFVRVRPFFCAYGMSLSLSDGGDGCCPRPPDGFFYFKDKVLPTRVFGRRVFEGKTAKKRIRILTI